MKRSLTMDFSFQDATNVSLHHPFCHANHRFPSNQTNKSSRLSSSLGGIMWQQSQPRGTLLFISKYVAGPFIRSGFSSPVQQFTAYCSTPLLLLLQPILNVSSAAEGSVLPFKAYEPTIELKDRVSRQVFIEAAYNVETGEAERIAVDWTARGGGSGTSCM